MPQDSPGLGAKGGNVSGLGKGCGGYGSFPMQFQQGIAPGAYGMAPNVCSVQPDFPVNQQGFSACRPSFCGNQQQQNNVFEQQNGSNGQMSAGFCQGNVSFGPQNHGCFGNQRSEAFGNVVNEGNQQFVFPPGINVGGCTPQAQRMQQVMSLSQGLSGAQLVTLVQGLQEQMRQQTRLTPEVFGQMPFNLGSSCGGVAPLDFGRDGLHNEAGHSNYVDVFSKSEKWIGAPPKPGFESWGSRESEVLGWASFLTDLTGWAAQASIEFSLEIEQSSRWPTAILWEGLSPSRRARAMRLHAILKSVLQDHARTSNLVKAFNEGISLEGGHFGLNAAQVGNGFEMLRQITNEYSLRTRSEALAMRTSFASKSFALSQQETSASTVVSDVIRRIDMESARFAKLLATLPPNVEQVGLQLSDADMLIILMRSLPEMVKAYTIHHSVGDTYQNYRDAARRWERQQRLFVEQLAGNDRRIHEVTMSPTSEAQWSGSQNEYGTEWYSLDDSWNVSAIGHDKCGRCGSRKHQTGSCQTDLTKTKCFRCHEFGHIGAHCPKNQSQNGKGKGSSGGKGREAQKGQNWNKGKGKKGKPGKGFGKKGKLNEMTEADYDTWWWYESDWNGYTYDGSVDHISQGYEDSWQWDSWSGWDQSWEQTENDAGNNEHAEAKNVSEISKQEAKTVGSLVLSPLFGAAREDVEFCGLHVGSCLSPQPFCVPQPFGEGSEGSQGVLVEKAVCEMFENENEPVSGQRGEDEFRACFPAPGQRLGLIGEKSTKMDEQFFDGLVCGAPMRVERCCFGKSTFLNLVDTVSVTHELDRFSEVIAPLLSELSSNDDIGWWLLDSGAAVTVLSKQCVLPYAATMVGDSDGLKFSAANGSSVAMHGRAEVSVFMCLWNDEMSHDVWTKAKLTTLVGDTRHNILSTTSLAQSGWTFMQGKDSVRLVHDETGQVAHEICMFAGCPWIRLHPHSGIDVKHSEIDLSHDLQTGGPCCPLSKAAQHELEQHRNQGHSPHNPNCTECAMGRTTHQHRRRRGDMVESELQADFGFLSQHGECSEIERDGAVKVLVLTECLSNAVGYVVVGDDLGKARGLISKWIQHFGLESETCSVILHTDSEQAVRNLVTGSTSRVTFQVKKAQNQQHQSIGFAERGVRRLRESLAVLRADLNQHNFDVRFEYEHLQESLTYLALCHNHYGRSRESDYSPLEMIASRRLSKPVAALHGSTVLAELPTSLRKECPNETRSIEAAFVHHGIDHGPIVQGKVRIDGQRYLAKFAARNIRQVSPISWKSDLCDTFLRPFQNQNSSEVPALDEGSEKERLDDKVSDLPMPLEPPKSVRNPLIEDPFSGGNVSDGEAKSSMKRTHESVGSDSKKVRFDEASEPATKFVKVTGCPSCDSGMNAPGIRHSAKCKRINNPVRTRTTVAVDPGGEEEPMHEEVGQSPSPYSPSIAPGSPSANEDIEIPQEEEYRERTKRQRDEGLEEFEREMKRERVDAHNQEEDMQLGLFWEDTVEPVHSVLQLCQLSSVPATKPSILIENMASIKFDSSVEHHCVPLDLGKGIVLVWKPTEAIDDSTLEQVDSEQCFEGMCEEVSNLQKCGAGVLLDAMQVEQLKKNHKHARVIQARWVVARKSDVKVRARIVAKDIRKSMTARQMGYSSPTPAVESLNIILAYAALHDYRMKSLDISHAFMHSPLPKSELIILKMPQSVSLDDGSPAFLRLERALNGLRDASLHWLTLLANTIRKSGVWTDHTDPCVYQGSVSKKNRVVGMACLVVYVDDILLVSSNLEAEEVVAQAIGSVVPMKVTGVILPSSDGGGALTFIGRQIHRRPGESALFLGIDPDYLQPSFDDYQIKRGTTAVPDISQHLEKKDEQSLKLLSQEGYHKFRKALGKMLWMSQTRHDIKLFLSLIGSLQSKPTCGADNALKSLLRFLYSDRHLLLRLPSGSEDLTKDSSGLVNRLHLWSDASHAPYRFNSRKGISGEVMCYQNAVIRTVAKQQQSISLSSCESELYAIQLAAQDSVGMSKFLQRFLFGMGAIEEFTPVDIWLESDSMSAIQLLQGVDLPRKSRHVEIRILWLKGKLDDGSLKIHHRYGEGNCADLFTKCLPTKDYLRLRAVLGFEDPERPISSLVVWSEENFAMSSLKKVIGGGIAIFEVCCDEQSNLRQMCEELDIVYVGVSANMQEARVFKAFVEQVKHVKSSGLWLHVHISTPCTFGSPLRHFHDDGDCSKGGKIWEEIMTHASGYLKHGNSRSFELPTHNAIWKKKETERVLKESKLQHECSIFLCQTGVQGSDGNFVGKSLTFCSDSFSFCKHLHGRFGYCRCQVHSSLSCISYHQTGFYTKKLAKGIIFAAILAKKRG